MKRSAFKNITAFDVFNYSLMILLAIIFVYPFWQLIVLSLSDAVTATSLGLKIIPYGLNIDSYKEVFYQDVIYRAYANTIFRTAMGMLLTVLVTYCGAYVLTKKKLPLRNVFTGMILFTMFFSGGLIPGYLQIQALGLYDTYWALILPSLTSAWNIVIMRNYISSVPEDLEEAACVDGAHPIRIAFQIMMPVCKPILAVVALWTAVGHWNAWFDALIYVPDRAKLTLQLMLRRIIIENLPDYLDSSVLMNTTVNTAPETVKAATIVVSIIPILLFYPFLQKYFVKGIMLGSLIG